METESAQIKQLEAALQQEQNARKNAAAMAERQRKRVEKLQIQLAEMQENNGGLMSDLQQMANELKRLNPHWVLQRQP